MAVCILGALAASSCSKDEFFGLEDSEVLDYSTKYEIAMSQAYADYAIACFEMAEIMNQPVDTTEMDICGSIKGKPVYAKTGSCTSALDLLEALKKQYPELAKADQIDFNEINEIALSKNDALKEIASKMKKETKSSIFGCAGSWAESLGHYGGGFGDEGWSFNLHFSRYSAVQSAIYGFAESYIAMTGGLIFGDETAASMSSSMWSLWPSVANQGSPQPESDFFIWPGYSCDAVAFGPEYDEVITLQDIINAFGYEYYGEGGRLHYVYDLQMNYEYFYY